MGKMKELHAEIVERLIEGESPEIIAHKLHIPVEWAEMVEVDMTEESYAERAMQEEWADAAANEDAAFYGSL